MPLAARLKVLVYVALYLLTCAGALIVARLLGAPGWLLLLGTAAAILAILAVDAFYPRVNLFAPAVVRIPPRNGAQAPIALTFDDGPVHPYTREILDILDCYGAKASFFCIGENVAAAPLLAGAITASGHTLGNHTNSHRHLMFATRKEIGEELDLCQRNIEVATGVSATYFRCPKGYKSPLLHAELRRGAPAGATVRSAVRLTAEGRETL